MNVLFIRTSPVIFPLSYIPIEIGALLPSIKGFEITKPEIEEYKCITLFTLPPIVLFAE